MNFTFIFLKSNNKRVVTLIFRSETGRAERPARLPDHLGLFHPIRVHHGENGRVAQLGSMRDQL